MGVRVTGAYSPQGGGFGPVRYGANLYAVLQTKTLALAGNDDYGLFKSTDNGATWALITAGANVNTYIEGVADVDDGNFMHGCLDNDFPANPYGYFVHLNTGAAAEEVAALLVTRVNFDIEEFDLQSSVGPNFYTGGVPEGAGNDPDKYVPSEATWAVAQFDDGSFAVLASLQSSADFTRGRVYYMTLSADLTTWGARAEVSGQADADDYAVSGITRGTSGRIHGFVWSEFSTLHHVLLATSGAGSLELIAAAEWNFRSAYSAALSGTTIRVLCAPEIGLGNTLRAFSATSADTPVFTEETVDSSSGVTFSSFWACLIGGATHFTGYSLDDGASDHLYLSQYDGSWTARIEIEPTLLPYFVTGQRMGDDLGFLFAEDGSGDETYFLLYSLVTVTMWSQWINSGRYGPWKYGSAWYAVCFLDVAVDQDLDYAFVPELMIVKSTNNGASWAQVGTTIALTDDTVVEDSAYGAYTFGTALDLSFSTNGYVYVLYTGTDRKLRVSRLNCVAEDWDLTGADGPDNLSFTDATATKDRRVFLLLAAATDGGFAVMVGNPLGIAADAAQVLVGRIESDLTWGALELVDGQITDRAYFPMGLMAVTSGRVHGLLWERNGDDLRALHTLVLGTGGSLANSTIEEVWAETHSTGHDPGIANGTPVACVGYYDGLTDRLMFLLTQDAGGGTIELAAATAESEDSPTWTIDVVHSDGATGFFYTATLVDVGGTPVALFHPFTGGAEFMAASYDGAAWSAPALTGIEGERIAAMYVQGAIGCFLIEQVNDTEYSYPLVFDLYGVPDTDLAACCCKIIGIYGV